MYVYIIEYEGKVVFKGYEKKESAIKHLESLGYYRYVGYSYMNNKKEIAKIIEIPIID